MISKLPSFLQQWGKATPSPPYNAAFHHKYPLRPVHAFWWPASRRVSRVLLFVPGNPGLLEFYTPFLSALYDKNSDGDLAILAHSHLGHTPKVAKPGTAKDYSLDLQIQSTAEALDAIKEEYGPECEIILLGHSVGAFIVTKVMKERLQDVTAAFLLFPTLCHIAQTPNGRAIAPILHPPYPRVVAVLSRILRVLPLFVVNLLFNHWPRTQIVVLRTLIHSPTAIFAALTLAYDEMRQIRDLDESLLTENRSKIWMYFAEKDDWVGKHRDEILRVFEGGEGAEDSVRIVRGRQDIPHAFCINHGEELASQCHEWLQRI